MNMSLTIPGLTPTTQALLLAILVGFMLLLLAALSLGNRLVWKMGLRNMRRRHTQTLIMLCGLLLSTAFLTIVFGLQDSFPHSVEADRLAKVGDVDESVTGTFTQAQLDSYLAQIRQQATVQAATAIYMNPLAANLRSQRTGHTQTNQYILALPSDFEQVYGKLSNSQGQTISLASLSSDQVLLSKSVAQAMDVKAGDQIQIAFPGIHGTLDATVYAILVNDPVVTGGELGWDGSYPEIILPLTTLQQFYQQNAHLSLRPNTICIKNAGAGAMTDSTTSQAVLTFLSGLFHVSPDTRASVPTNYESTLLHPLKPTRVEDNNWNPLAGKRDFLEVPAARQFVLLVPIFTGLLVGAGMLLMILLCLLLAADRRVELGIARAVGLQRRHLIQALLIECCGYSLLAVVPGVLLGLGGLQLEVLLVSTVPSLSFLSAAHVPLQPWISWQSLLTVLCLGLLTTLIVTWLTAIWISRSEIVAAIRNLDDLPERVGFAELRRAFRTAPTLAQRAAISGRALWELFACGPLTLLGGGLLLLLGQRLSADWLLHLGVVTLIVGAGLLLTWLGTIVRLPATFSRWLGATLIGLGWLVYGLQAGSGMILLIFTPALPQDQIDLVNLLPNILLSLLLPLIGMVMLVMMNSDALATVLHMLISRVRGLAPVSRASLAYPLTFRFRTGVAVSLLSLVLFLVMLIITNNLGIGQQVADTSQKAGAQQVAMQNAYTTSMTQFLASYLIIGLLFSALSLGVIAARAVVERQQQIGMLRALGFSRALVRRSFLLEASFVVTLSLVISAILAWWLVSQIAHANAKDFSIPVLPTLGLLLGCYLISFFCTFVPAQRASGILPAEALRYE